MIFAVTRANSLASLAIRARLWEPWSHALVVEGDWAIDSTFKLGGVRRRELTQATHGASAIDWALAPLPYEARAREWLYHQIGRDYDWRPILGWVGGGRDWRDPYAWFCFELVAGMIEAGSEYRFVDMERVTGVDLLRAAAALRGEL